MSFENAIAGLNQLQQSFQNVAERRQKEKFFEEEKELKISEAAKDRAHEMEKLGKSLTSAERQASIHVGPQHRKINLEEKQIERELKLGEEQSKLVGESEYGSSLSGKLLKAERAYGINVDKPINTEQLLVQSTAERATSNDPAERAIAIEIWKRYDKLNQIKAKSDYLVKLQAQIDAGKEFIKTQITTQELAGAVEIGLKRAIPNYNLFSKKVNWGLDKTESGPLATFMAENKIPAEKLSVAREEIARALAQSDNRYRTAPDAEGNYMPNNSAYSEATRQLDKVNFLGGQWFLETDAKGNQTYKPDQYVQIEAGDELAANAQLKESIKPEKKEQNNSIQKALEDM